MASLKFTANQIQLVAFGAVAGNSNFHGREYIMTWDGTAAGGKLRVYSEISNLITPVPNSHVTIGELDGDGNVRQQMRFWTKGELYVQLSGAGGGIDLDVRLL